MASKMLPSSLPALLAPLNEALIPALQLGFGSPLPLTTGIVVLEVTGRRSGVKRRVPLVCTDYGAFLTVSTVRNESQWIRNLAAEPRVSLWLRGRQRTVLSAVFQRGERLDGSALPEDPSTLAARALTRCSGMSLAILHFQ
jgi:hypothetical protein